MHKPALNAIWLIEMLAFCVVTVMHFLRSVPLELFPSTSKYQSLVYFNIESLKLRMKRIFSMAASIRMPKCMYGFTVSFQVATFLSFYGKHVPVPAQDIFLSWLRVQ